MSDTNYTKGDWEVYDRWNVRVAGGGRLVANCGGYSSNYEDVVEENEANAHLIAAAPDMYEALTLVKQWAKDPEMKWGEIAPIIDNALAKTRGRE